MKLQKGFTLMELMIVVAIVAMLASLAMPAYNDYVIRGKLVEATSTLSDARIKMEQYFQDHRTYNPAGDGTTCPPAIPDSTANFKYSCSGLSAGGYTITATGINSSLSVFSYTINEANTRRTTGLKADWGTAPMECWIIKKGDAC